MLGRRLPSVVLLQLNSYVSAVLVVTTWASVTPSDLLGVCFHRGNQLALGPDKEAVGWQGVDRCVQLSP